MITRCIESSLVGDAQGAVLGIGGKFRTQI